MIQWDVAGTFYFTEASSGGLFLAVAFDNALLTTYSPNSFTMGKTATLQSSDDVDSGLDFISTLLFQSLTGVSNLSLNGSEDLERSWNPTSKAVQSPG